MLRPLASAGQQEPTSPTAASNLSPTATATPDASLKGPRLIATVVSDIYAPQHVEDVGPASYPSGINPLTGLPYPSEEARMRRNLIVKVSNWPPRVRPQHAINQADLVYEMESEGGVTRFAAIFRSKAPEKVGSVRSARLVDMELLNMYAALLAYSGTSGPVREIYRARVNRRLLLSPSLGDNCEEAGFCRDESVRDRGYEHTLFGDTRQMWQTASRRDVNIGFRAIGFAFDLQPDAGGRDVKDVYINWYNRTYTRWQYEEDSRRYLRYSDGAPHYDATDDTQLWADNLVMLQVAHNRRPDLFEAGAINESYEVALWGHGPAYVMREGQLYRGSWSRLTHNRGGALSLIHADGTPIVLKPGRTWVTVMRSLDAVEVSDIRADMRAAANAKAQAEE
ncbi:MAG: DUF3048 domain-containing protein [Chloroflexi bacterium]|nr:DUF3048 domain-containing protein [Chloroflexota bacterium]